MWSAKYEVQKGSELFYVIQKEKRQPGLFSFKLQITNPEKGINKYRVLLL